MTSLLFFRTRTIENRTKTRIFPIVTLLKSKKFKTLITAALREEELHRQVNEMLETGIIEASESSYRSNIFLVPKPPDKEGNKSGIRKRADTSARGRNRPERGRRGVGAASPDSTAQRRNRLERDRRGVGAASPDSTVRITKDICPL
ncbi:unnamed protein product [Trichogramma brassicae]|uniref:Uncharacterized protein n=1 Tax=Trichogramma brassicae TaxID=86971 RepID=A0A6H5I1H2_9HYME|nr:unnamed protein product [Trichogramma brassicae]